MEVSSVCQNFITHASAVRWRDAVVTLNGLTMYEMLRSLKALDPTDIIGFNAALAPIRATVNAPRIDYALTVVQTSQLPPTAPAGLPPDQVVAARQFAAKPYSILQELVPKGRLPAFNVGLTAVDNALMQQLFGNPRSEYSSDCQPVTNPDLSRRTAAANVGPFTATGLDFRDGRSPGSHVDRSDTAALGLPRPWNGRHALCALRSWVDNEHLQSLLGHSG